MQLWSLVPEDKALHFLSEPCRSFGRVWLATPMKHMNARTSATRFWTHFSLTSSSSAPGQSGGSEAAGGRVRRQDLAWLHCRRSSVPGHAPSIEQSYVRPPEYLSSSTVFESRWSLSPSVSLSPCLAVSVSLYILPFFSLFVCLCVSVCV